MATNLDFQEQLNKLIQEQNKLLQETSRLTRDQVAMTRELVNSMRDVNFREVSGDVQNTQQAIQNARNETQNYGSTNRDVFEQVKKSLEEAVDKEEKVGKGIEDLGKKVRRFATATAVIDGFVQGLRLTTNVMHGLVSLGGSLVGTLGHLAASIISIPFKMLTGLIHMSDAGGGSNELQQALEDIRKEFGQLRETSGRAIIDMARSMKGELSNTGLSVNRIFGTLAERLKTIQEYAHNLGPLFAVLSGQFVKNAEAIGAYYKGLGLTAEAQKAVATRSMALGTAVTEELREIANYSLQLSKAFNGAAGSAKEISRDMGNLMADFQHFGGMATREIAQAVVYFRRLGVEVSKVLGVIERYDNFQDAADGAARLSQAFGLNVDALELMKAQNPAQRVEQLRKAFFQAGRSVENMTRQERALLAQQTGLDASALDLVFSMKNQGLSYDQVTKKADAAKKKQVSQAEAMQQLAGAIERLVRSGGSLGSGGFLDRFIQGFTVGIQRSREFRKIMYSLRQDLRIAYFEGIRVGRAFVDMFPGVRDVFKGIADLFEPRRFRAMFRRISESFKEFFKEMTTNPQTALPRLLDRLKKDFFAWFNPNQQNGSRILDGFKSFFKALSQIAGSMLKIAIQGLTNGIRFITDLISGRKSLTGPGSSGLGFFGQLFVPILRAITEAGPDLWRAVKSLFGELWKKAQPWIANNWVKVVGVLLGPSLIAMVSRTIAASLGMSLLSGLWNWVKGGGVAKGLQSVQGAVAQQVTRVTQAASNLPTVRGAGGAGAGAAATQAIAGADQAAKAANTSAVSPSSIPRMLMITAFITVGMAGLLYGIFRFAKAMQDNRLTIQSVAAAAGAMVATAGAMLAISFSVKALSAVNINPGMVGRIVVGVGIVTAVGALMAVGARGLIAAFGNVEISRIGRTTAVMAASGAFFLAAAGITAIAAGIGAIAIGTGGLGAVAIGIGLASITATIAIMAREGMSMMRIINDFRPGSGFAEKARVFVDLMKGIGSFVAAVAQMIAATRPGILDFIRGSGAEQQRATLRQVETLITSLGTQIVGIIQAIRRNVQALSGTESELRSAQTLGTLLTGIGELASSLRPPSEALSSPGFFASLNGDTVSRRISLITDYVNEVSNQLRLFVRTITNVLVGELRGGISEDQKRAVEVIPPLLASVGQLAQALRPSAAMIQELNRGSDFAGQLQHISRFVRDTMHALEGSRVFTMIQGLITSIAQSVSGLNPQQLKSIQAIAPIVAPAFQVVAQIATILSSMAIPPRGPAESNAGALFQLSQTITTFFARASTDLPALVGNMRQAFAGMSVTQATSLAKGMEGLQKFFEVLTGVPRLLQSFPRQTGEGLAGPGDIRHITNLLHNLLFGSGGNNGITSVIESLTSDLNRITNTITNPREFAQKIGAIKNIFEVVGQIPGMIQTFSRIQQGVENVREVNVERISTVVRDMINETNALATEIRNIRPINIDTSLRSLGNSLGLGSSGTYTIQNRNFDINVNFTVSFNNDSLDAFELAMLRRAGPNQTRITHGDLTR